MENQNGMSELYQEWIKEDYKYIDFIKLENKVFQEIREKYQDDLELVELCREQLFDNFKLIKSLSERIIYGKDEIEKLSRI